MGRVEVPKLTAHVKRLLGVEKAEVVETVRLIERFEGQVVWDGVVHVFRVRHPQSDTCYAWSSPVTGSKRRKFYAVLKLPPVDSPATAVRAAILFDYKKGEASKTLP